MLRRKRLAMVAQQPRAFLCCPGQGRRGWEWWRNGRGPPLLPRGGGAVAIERLASIYLHYLCYLPVDRDLPVDHDLPTLPRAGVCLDGCGI